MSKISTSIPKKARDRLSKGLSRFQPILEAARDRDVNEADTVTIITDMLAYILGYDKFGEITKEHAIRGSYCDLAVVVEDKLEILIEVKAIGLDLKDAHTRQAVNYAANQGTEWVVLTNGILWKVFHVSFTKPISPELVYEFDILELDPKDSDDLESLFLLSKEGLRKSVLDDFHTQKQALSRFNLAAIILSEPVLKVIRRELRRLSPGISIDLPDIETVIKKEVIKREVVEGEKAEDIRRRVQKALEKQAKSKKKKPVKAATAEKPERPEPPEPKEQQSTEEEKDANTGGSPYRTSGMN